jgi:transcriptional regulator with XRE-family HTH domain
MKTVEILNKHKSDIPSKWREAAEYRRENSRWLMYSAMIALMVRQRMSELGVTQIALAEKLGCTQQHVSTLLKGKSNLTLETIAKLEDALSISLITGDAMISVSGYNQEHPTAPRAYLSDSESDA